VIIEPFLRTQHRKPERVFGLKAAPAEKTLDLSDVIAEHALRKAPAP
jgi:hypothetical protein